MNKVQEFDRLYSSEKENFRIYSTRSPRSTENSNGIKQSKQRLSSRSSYTDDYPKINKRSSESNLKNMLKNEIISSRDHWNENDRLKSDRNSARKHSLEQNLRTKFNLELDLDLSQSNKSQSI
jgi:hypothetical protein